MLKPLRGNALRNFASALQPQIKGELLFDKVSRGLYATDASIYQIEPVAVVLPRDEADVRAAVRAAADYKIPILPRGSGTSLNGQACGACLIIDFTKYMNKILELNVEQRWVRVQPGIVLDELNAVLAKDGLLFAPDPATGNRATIGGMMGNNSSGTHSIIYGITRDHVLACKVLLSDGNVIECKQLSPDEYNRRAAGPNGNKREAQILSEFKKIITDNHDEIEKRFPKIMRRVQGYNLDSFINTDRWNLTELMVGSEGTLGVILEAKLNLVALPKHQALCVVHFTELIPAIHAVTPILKHSPSAVEILDSEVISNARTNLRTKNRSGFLQGEPKSVLIVEFQGETDKQTADKARNLADDLARRHLGFHWPIYTDPAEQQNIWEVRKSGLGLMYAATGARKPLSFIEDGCVPVELLPEYIEQILQFCKKRDVPVALYAHAGVGTIHLKPYLNLKEQIDIDHLKAIAEFSFGLIKKYGGSISSEHGDGRIRSPFLERFFGLQIYNAFRQVKKLFDPHGLLNPGVIIDPDPLDLNLRFGIAYRTTSIPTEYHYRQTGGFAAAVEMCSGLGACRQNLIGTMCPSYRATRDERHSTRGRANALRLAISGQLGPDALTSERLFEVLELCLSCKACKSECPSNVDLARIKSEFLQLYHDTHGISLREKIIANSPQMAARIAGWKAPMVNAVQKNRLFRRLLEKIVGFDTRRIPPAYARLPFPRWFSQRPQPNGRLTKKVVLFDDTYMNYHETNVGISAVELLESCGYQVTLAHAGCCQRPRISHGFLRDAKRDGEKTLRHLDKFIAQGLKIVVCEPGCCSALTDDLPDLIDDEQLAQRIKENIMMIDEFLAREVESGRLDCEFTSPYDKILIHGHCHQKSLYGTTYMKNLLDRVPGISVQEIDSGCCGMAGSFGYEKEHYDLSIQIGEDRLFPAVRNRYAGAVVVACGFSCRHQIADATHIKPLHWTQSLRGKSDS